MMKEMDVVLIFSFCFCFLTLNSSTFVCPTEILAFNDRVDEFRSINAEVLAASVDSHFTHLAWIK